MKLYKMTFMKWLCAVLCIVCLLNFIATRVLYRSKSKELKEDSDCTDVSTAEHWKERVSVIITCIASALIALFVLYLSIIRHNAILWSFMIASFYAVQATVVFPGVKSVCAIISGKGTGELSKEENEAVLISTAIPIVLFNTGIIEKIYSFIITFSPVICSDWLLVIFYWITISSLVFLICAQIINPLHLLLRLLHKMVSTLHIKEAKNYIYSGIKRGKDRINTYKFICIPLIEYTRQKYGIIKILLCILVVLAFCIDILLTSISIICMLVLYLLYYFCHFCSWCYAALCVLRHRLLSLSDRNTVAISFRTAIIAGLGCTVVLNRYDSFLYYQQEGTAVLEFLSSVIIIPVLIEWISSYKKTRKK